MDNLVNDQPSQENNNVVLVDPNIVNINSDQINAIPQYQDMHVFVEMIATRKGRTVLTIEGNGVVLDEESSADNVRISLLGANQSKDTDRSGLFTTAWSEENTGKGYIVDGFEL
jgi:hypothetical protein